MNPTNSKELIRPNTTSTRTSHYVCFSCRKQFKKPSFSRYVVGYLGKEHLMYQGFDHEQQKYPCPQCGQSMTLMGKNFRAPKHQDLQAWQIAERLAQAGFTHGYHSGLRYPKKLKEVAAFIKHWRATPGEQLLQRWSKR